MMSGLPAMQSPQNASRAPTGACTRHRYGFAFTAVRRFRHQVIFGSLVPPRPLSQRRFDDLGRTVVSVVGCAQHRRLVHVLIDSHRNLDDWYLRTDSLHRVPMLTEHRPRRQTVRLRPPPDFSVLFRQTLVITLRHSHMCTRERGSCPRGTPICPRVARDLGRCHGLVNPGAPRAGARRHSPTHAPRRGELPTVT